MSAVILILLTVGILIAVGGLYAFLDLYKQRRAWNHGRCRCGEYWSYLSTDTKSGGYRCNKCSTIIWLDWIHPKVRKPNEHQRATRP